MEDSLAVAKALYKMYTEKLGRKMDEMKMHKLMYFSQRESLIQTGEPLFDEPFNGWRYGPVLHSVRTEYVKPNPFSDVSNAVCDTTVKILNDVIDRIGSISSWNLSMLSHEELSWKMARNGIDPSENGSNLLALEAIKLDAVRERIARGPM